MDDDNSSEDIENLCGIKVVNNRMRFADGTEVFCTCGNPATGIVVGEEEWLPTCAKCSEGTQKNG